jgi:VanZ family protein
MIMAAIIPWLLVVCWMGVIFALSSIPSLRVPFAHSYDFVLRKLAHIGEYAVLTVLLLRAFQRHTSSRVRAWLFAALAAALYGLSDEWHQSWIAGRYGSFRDVGIDALGIVASYALASYRPYQRMRSTWQCPKCHAMRVYRSRRRGRLEWCSRLLCLAPFRCDICSHRFWHLTLRGR